MIIQRQIKHVSHSLMRPRSRLLSGSDFSCLTVSDLKRSKQIKTMQRIVQLPRLNQGIVIRLQFPGLYRQISKKFILQFI